MYGEYAEEEEDKSGTDSDEREFELSEEGKNIRNAIIQRSILCRDRRRDVWRVCSRYAIRGK